MDGNCLAPHHARPTHTDGKVQSLADQNYPSNPPHNEKDAYFWPRTTAWLNGAVINLIEKTALILAPMSPWYWVELKGLMELSVAAQHVLDHLQSQQHSCTLVTKAIPGV